MKYLQHNPLQAMPYKRLALTEYLLHFLGQPYYWGGDGRHNKGFDCSGLVQEGLASIGMWDKADRNAQMLYRYWLPRSHPLKELNGNIIFFGSDIDHITHIGITLNAFQYLEAGGGGSDPKSGGMVRIRPLVHRNDCVAVLNIIGD